jgi:transposase
MVKTRSQAGNITIKKEEEEEDCKPSLRLGSVRNTRTSTRIAKRKPPILNNRPLPAQQVKVEEDTATKSLLKLPFKFSKGGPKPKISQEQINQLIDYIVNENMSIKEASRKVNMSRAEGFHYYTQYKNDPDKKIPLPRNQNQRICTQVQVENLIRYINNDEMTVKEASAKANMTCVSGKYYYAKHLKNPNHAIRTRQFYHTQRNEFIDYVVRDKMSLVVASKKAKLNYYTAKDYYRRYFKIQNPDIPPPSHIPTPRTYTQEQIKELISYIVDDKMSIKAASRKANVCPTSAVKYYQKYLIDNNMEIPVLKKTYTQDEINNLIRYMIVDKMSLTAASKKANIERSASGKRYRQYLLDHNLDLPIPKFITQEQKSKLIGYIVHDKMSITAASKKANMHPSTASRHYQKYLNNQKHRAPA